MESVIYKYVYRKDKKYATREYNFTRFHSALDTLYSIYKLSLQYIDNTKNDPMHATYIGLYNLQVVYLI